MPQILAVTTQKQHTETERDALRADIMRQLDGCDAVVLILPPGVQLQNTFLPAAAVVVPAQPDAVEEEPAAIPPHVWLYRKMMSAAQVETSLGRDETNGLYAVAIDQLTDEQRAIPHVAAQLDEQNNDM